MSPRKALVGIAFALAAATGACTTAPASTPQPDYIVHTLNPARGIVEQTGDVLGQPFTAHAYLRRAADGGRYSVSFTIPPGCPRHGEFAADVYAAMDTVSAALDGLAADDVHFTIELGFEGYASTPRYERPMSVRAVTWQVAPEDSGLELRMGAIRDVANALCGN